ncbi:hypothetical protein [Lysobacter sp. HA35]
MKTFYSLLALATLAACSPQQPAPSADNPLARAPMAQCAKDTDCKGDRICEGGACRTPAAPTPEPAEATPAASVEAAKPGDPSATPKFKDYPVAVYSGPAGKLDLSDETARTFKTRLREAMQEPADFAGEYVLAGWGCGTGCTMSYLVSRRTGKVLDLGFQRELVFSLQDEEGVELQVGTLADDMKPDSRLLVVKEVSEPDKNNACKALAKFYVLEGEKLTLLKTVELAPIVGKPFDLGES